MKFDDIQYLPSTVHCERRAHESTERYKFDASIGACDMHFKDADSVD